MYKRCVVGASTTTVRTDFRGAKASDTATNIYSLQQTSSVAELLDVEAV